MLRRRVCTGVVLLLSSGCFSDPPSQGSGDETGGSTSSAASTGTSSTSGESSGETTTTGGGEASSSSTGELGTTSTGADETGSSTGFTPGCQSGEVQVGTLCLAPLVVQGVDTQSQPAAAFGGGPCLPTLCPDGLALGGGFLLDGVLAHGSHRDQNMEAWLVCGAEEPKVSPNTWRGFAQCALGSGDVVVNTETHSINGNEGLTCFEADCPPGTTLVGGGGRWGPNLAFQSSEPASDGSQWEVCGSGMGEMAMIEVDAHCAVLPMGMGTQVYEELQSVAPGDTGCAQVSCNGGLALAGGVSTGISMTATGSYPEADGWAACGRSDGAFNVQVRARVLCLEN